VTFELILVGYGNVARRFVALLEEERRALARDEGFDVRIVGVVTRRLGGIHSPRGVDLSTAVATPGATIPFLKQCLRQSAAAARARRLVVVETTTLDVVHGEPATTHVRTALAGGAHVITANKGPAAFAYRRLARAAARAHRRFLFEGAVMDGIPIFSLARETMPVLRILGFRGVVNTTTNFILAAMERGEALEPALAAMQAAGIAEADASLDLDGWDAAAKTAALANVLLDANITPHAVAREGIGAATQARAAAARHAGRRLKLVARADVKGDRLAASVGLEELPADDLLAGLEGEQNGLVLRTDLLGELAIVQRGSSLTQTAYALLSDLTAIARDVRSASPRPARSGERRDRTPSRRVRRSR